MIETMLVHRYFLNILNLSFFLFSFPSALYILYHRLFDVCIAINYVCIYIWLEMLEASVFVLCYIFLSAPHHS